MAALAGFAIMIASATPASAAVRLYSYSQYNYADWEANGDKLNICDGQKDGLSVAVDARWYGTEIWMPRKWHTAGGSDVGQPPKCTERSYGDIADDRYLVMRVCLGTASDNTIREWLCGPWYEVRT